MSDAPRDDLHLRPAASPSRCPFCHAEVNREREPWVACHACLAPHHDGCWREGGRCAGCGETRCIGDDSAQPGEAPARAAAPEPGPRLELELRGRRAHFEGAGSLWVPVEPGDMAALVVRIKNETDRPARVELRDLPPWLRAPEPAADVAPGKALDLHATLGDAAVHRRVCGGEIVDGTLVVATDGDARAVKIEFVLAPGALRVRRRRRLSLAAVAAVALISYLTLMGSMRSARIDDLAEHAITTQGRVTKLTPSNHNQMYYEYEADGVVYERNDFARGESVGDPVLVSYLPGNPDVSVRGTAYDTYVIPGFAVALPFVGLMFTMIFFVVTAVAPPRRRPSPR